MKKICIYVLIEIMIISSACKKTSPALPPNHNEINATVVVSPTSTITINARGSKALIGLYGFLGGPTYVVGTNDANAEVYLSVFPIISGPGTYDFAHGYRCQYRPNRASQTTPIYENNGANAGSITFTTANDNYAEGNFSAVCRCTTFGCVIGVDSVIVTGTFKGDYLTH